MPKPIEQKIKEDHPEFFDACQTLTESDIDARLAQMAKDSEAVSEAAANDKELKETKDKASYLGAPYREAKNVLKLKLRYLVKLLKDRGRE